MVLWLKKTFKNNWKDLLAAAIFTFILMIPYIFSSLLPIEHDTFFHVSRIEQLSRSITEGNFFPALYPYENNGYGYASPLFYNDVLLIIPALLHLAGMAVSTAYKFSVICASFFSCFAMTKLVTHISHKQSAGWIAGAAYLFSNYRITDIYVRGAFGEILAFTFLPIMVLGMYEILVEDSHKWSTLTIGLTGLILAHNLTFLLGTVLCIILFLFHLRTMNCRKVWTIFKGAATAFLLTVWYTFPMIEQLHSQTLVVSYYGSSSNLQDSSMNLWQFFINKTVFGFSGNSLSADSTMTVNVGWFLTFAPLLWFLVKKETRKLYPFVTKALIIGYIFMILPSSVFPWNSFALLRILQFPWRLNTIALVLLCIPSSMACAFLLQKKALQTILICIMCGECIYHVIPDFSRTFGMTSSMTWSDITAGEIVDPYYSADYSRVELAGGDYLPISHPDFRNRSKAIKNSKGEDIISSYTKTGTTLSFSVSEQYSNDKIVLPLTWYKGYHVYKEENGQLKEIECAKNYEGMVTFISEGEGTYYCTYENTPLRVGTSYISWLCAAALVLSHFFEKKHISLKGLLKKHSS